MCRVKKAAACNRKKVYSVCGVLKALLFSSFFLGEGGLFWQGAAQPLAGQTMQETVSLFICLFGHAEA